MKKIISLLFISLLLPAAHALTIKVAVLTPEGTSWAKSLKEMTKEVKKATNGKVKFKIYYGGTQGDEADVLRKVYVKQLHGGVFTGKTLGDIYGDVRVMEIPFTFQGDREKGQKTLKKMESYFNQGFIKKNFKNLGFFEIGMVYFISQKNTENLKSLKGLKIWSWEGDRIVASMIDKLNLVSVPLPLPDVLSSLSTGIVEAAYAPPMGIVALQWNTKIKYLVDFPIAYSIGAFLVDMKRWNKIPKELQEKVEKIAAKYIKKVNEGNNKDNIEALTAMKSIGVKFIQFPDQDIQEAKGVRSKIISELEGKLFSKEALNRLRRSL